MDTGNGSLSWKRSRGARPERFAGLACLRARFSSIKPSPAGVCALAGKAVNVCPRQPPEVAPGGDRREGSVAEANQDQSRPERIRASAISSCSRSSSRRKAAQREPARGPEAASVESSAGCWNREAGIFRKTRSARPLAPPSSEFPFINLKYYNFNSAVDPQNCPEAQARRFRALLLEEAGRHGAGSPIGRSHRRLGFASTRSRGFYPARKSKHPRLGIRNAACCRPSTGSTGG